MDKLLQEIRQCKVCEKYLLAGVNPILSAHPNSKIAIIGQAPGSIVHKTGIPWDDKSGERLREWLNIDQDLFYNEEIFAIVPMGFCYPGKGKTGDLPPRKECAPLWHKKLLTKMPKLELIMLIGAYAQNYYLGERNKNTLTETVKNTSYYLPTFIPLPHPSPRNNIWLKKNAWFEIEILPILQRQVELICKQNR